MDILNKPSLFWDTNDVDPHKNAEFVMDRILAFGDADDVKWAIGYYGRDAIAKRIPQSRNLDKRSRNFWCQFLNLDSHTCTQKFSEQTHSVFSKR